MKKISTGIWFGFVVAFAAGTAAGYFLPMFRLGWDVSAGGSALRENNDQYRFINPLLLCGVTEAKPATEYTALQSAVQGFIDGHADRSDTISFYFRDLNKGGWTGLNEDTLYSPASLVKVPLMIAYFKLAESQPSVLTRQLTYDGSYDGNKTETFKSPYDIKPGTYLVQDLIKAMIVNSDNNATQLLLGNIDPSYMNEIFSDFGLPTPLEQAPQTEYMTVKTYSYFFRVLYNATYLSRQYSERALMLLAGPDFPQGIQSGVPAAVTVAQKFGERTWINNGALQYRELHDCGIVYAPSDPYLVCVMTKGNNFQDLTNVISGISKVVYDFVGKQ